MSLQITYEQPTIQDFNNEQQSEKSSDFTQKIISAIINKLNSDSVKNCVQPYVNKLKNVIIITLIMYVIIVVLMLIIIFLLVKILNSKKSN